MSDLAHSQCSHNSKTVVPHVQTLYHGVQDGVAQLSYVLLAALQLRYQTLEV